ncbi:MAG: hydantoinase/oxoprolinase family protein [Candidatus Eisenbacteria bacterium]|nr:hydantoinase/oxoprolinase family protein [Candidatus Eisenbacteria bacterium]
MIRIGVDTGGTFTDFVVEEAGRLTRFKLPSTPDDPSRAVLEGIRRALGARGGIVLHGTTVATNALLTRGGARVALVATAGFEDVLQIGRQARPELYRLEPRVPAPLVPARLRLGLAERVGPRGETLRALGEPALRATVRKVAGLKPDAVAVALLHAYANPAHERRVAAALRRAGLRVSVSHELAPEFREYERTATTVANAYVQPVLELYLTRLARRLGAGRTLWVMSSSGGLMRPDRAAREPVRTLLSGPAGGVAAALRLGRALGRTRLITFDMGGTSTDVALLDGEPEPSLERTLEGLPLRVPMLDIHTVGAGGGSYVRADATGALRTGPESAGADPGPAAWGEGDEPTLTDAHLVLGTLWPEFLLGPPADRDLAEDAFAGLAGRLGLSVERAARGALDVADAVMERALRRISVERGHDPSDFTLVSFGGAGGLHAARLASRLGVRRVLAPLDAAAFSAWGLLGSAARSEHSAPVLRRLDEMPPARLERLLDALERRVRAGLRREGARRVTLVRRVDLRYAGQSYELTVPFGPRLRQAFDAAHRRAYGVCDPSRPVEVVSLRVRGAGPAPRAPLPGFEKQPYLRRFLRPTVYFGRPVPVVPAAELGPREVLKGPAFVLTFASTIVVPEGWQAGRAAAGAVELVAAETRGARRSPGRAGAKSPRRAPGNPAAKPARRSPGSR